MVDNVIIVTRTIHVWKLIIHCSQTQTFKSNDLYVNFGLTFHLILSSTQRATLIRVFYGSVSGAPSSDESHDLTVGQLPHGPQAQAVRQTKN